MQAKNINILGMIGPQRIRNDCHHLHSTLQYESVQTQAEERQQAS